MLRLVAVGLLLGTRMWYAMWGAEEDDDASFERRVDNLVREIGERGKLMVAESVPPLREPTPAPAPAPSPPSSEPASTRAPAARAPAATTALFASASPSIAHAAEQQAGQSANARITHTVLPSMEQQPVVQQQPSSSSVATSQMGTSLMEVSAFMTEQLKTQMASQRAHDKEQHAEVVRLLEGQLEAQRHEIKAQRQAIKALEAKLAPACAISQEQLAALQSRIQTLHVAKLLSDDELFSLEDACGDIIELESSIGGRITSEMAQANPSVSKLSRLVALCERVTSDEALARQIRRRLA